MKAVTLTAAARGYLCDLIATAKMPAILLSVTSKGCGGHTYTMRFVDGDFGGEAIDLDEGRRLILDDKALLVLWGTSIDYVVDGLEQRLEFVNPNEAGRCGCGMSFTLPPDTAR